MTLFNPPYAQQLLEGNNILLAGAGGGYDIFSGFPLYFYLRQQGKQVHLANLSFTMLDFFKHADWLTDGLVKVTADLRAIPNLYFPELYLSQWFREHQHEEVPIYAFSKTGVLPLHKRYQHLTEELNIDTIVLIDGGTDSLMRGDEDGLGTPAEDFASLAAVAPLNIPRKMLCCLGFGVDHYHGVSNDLSFAAIAELTQTDHFLGSTSILPSMPEAVLYKKAAEYTFQQMPEDISIVSSSILSAVAGYYGDHHTTPRTQGSRLWINPLMAVYWFFDLAGIAERNQLLHHIYLTESFSDVARTILHQRYRLKQSVKRRPIPD